MGDPARIAATFAFLEEVWRGRSRLLASPSLLAWVRAVERAPDGAEAAGDLLDALLPWDRGAPRVVCLADQDLARALHGRRGVVVEPSERLGARLADPTWEVAVVDRSQLVAAGHAAEAQLSRVVAAGRDRRVILLADADETDYEVLADTALALGGGRILGVYPARTFGFIEYGDVTQETNGDAWDGEDGGAWDADEAGDALALEDDDEREEEGDAPRNDESEGEEDVPVAYDNTIGPAEPEPVAWVALCGQWAFQSGAEGFSLVEVDPAGFGTPTADEDRAILAAREQELRWRLERAEAELAELRARPVGELEAKVAELEARLAAAGVDPPNANRERGGTSEPVHGGYRAESGGQPPNRGAPVPAPDLLRGAEMLEQWVRRLEAGGTVPLPALRDDLHRLVRHLRRRFHGTGSAC